MRRELVGPLSEDERLSTPPHLRYATGHIGPDLDGDDLSEVDPSHPDEPDASPESQADFQPGEIATESGSDSSEASSISRSRQQSLTSIGIAFCVRSGAAFDATAQWGEYTASGEVFAREAKRDVVGLDINGPHRAYLAPDGPRKARGRRESGRGYAHLFGLSGKRHEQGLARRHPSALSGFT